MQRYFDHHSLLREVVGHRLTALSGPARAAGDGRASGGLRRASSPTPARSTTPTRRLRRTGRVMDAVAFGTKARGGPDDGARARRCTRGCSGELRRGRGPLPGRHALPRRRSRAAAVDPRRAGGVGDARLRRTSARCRATSSTRCGSTTARSGRRFGLREREMPRDIDAFEAYMADMYASGDLYVTAAARELAIDIVLHPPVPAAVAAAGRAREPGDDRLAARRACAASTASAGTRCAPSRCAAAPSTSGAWSCRWCLRRWRTLETTRGPCGTV